MNALFFRVALPLFLLAGMASAAQKPAAFNWESSVVTIETTRNRYDLQQPWTKRPANNQRTAVVISPKELLTTAEELSDHTLVRLQKGGRGKWWDATVTWIDYHANLAIVVAKEDAFWTGLKPVKLSTAPPDKDKLQIIRWKNGNLEVRKAEFNQFAVDEGRLTFVAQLQMDIDSEMAGVGWSEPIVSDGKIVGLATGSAGNDKRALPSVFIQRVLNERTRGWRGLGYFPFVWRPSENPANLAHLKLPGEQRGVMIIEVPKDDPNADALRVHDLLLQVEGFDIDLQGYYRDPEYGLLMLENLSTRNKFAGDTVKLKVWRDGREVTVDYKLPKAEYSRRFLPDQRFDAPPEYLVAGGFVFQPLDKPLLRTWGGDWKRSAPFRLTYYDNDAPTKERPALVLLTSVLPDAYNVGYQELRFVVVDKVNGRKIARVSDLVEAFKESQNGFHVIEFVRTDALRRIVVDASKMAEATERVLDRFGIQKDRNVQAVTQ